MAKSMSSQWIRSTILDILRDSETTDPAGGPNRPSSSSSAHQQTRLKLNKSRVVQVTRANDSVRFFDISDKEVTITVMLTGTCYNNFLNMHQGATLASLKNSLVKLEDWHVSTVMQSAGNRDVSKFSNLHISFPLSLQCAAFTWLGAHDCNLIGEPRDINRDVLVREILSKHTYSSLTNRLCSRQFPAEVALPDPEGSFSYPAPYDDLHPLRWEHCIIPASQLILLQSQLLPQKDNESFDGKTDLISTSFPHRATLGESNNNNNNSETVVLSSSRAILTPTQQSKSVIVNAVPAKARKNYSARGKNNRPKQTSVALESHTVSVSQSSSHSSDYSLMSSGCDSTQMLHNECDTWMDDNLQNNNADDPVDATQIDSQRSPSLLYRDRDCVPSVTVLSAAFNWPLQLSRNGFVHGIQSYTHGGLDIRSQVATEDSLGGIESIPDTQTEVMEWNLDNGGAHSFGRIDGRKTVSSVATASEYHNDTWFTQPMDEHLLLGLEQWLSQTSEHHDITSMPIARSSDQQLQLQQNKMDSDAVLNSNERETSIHSMEKHSSITFALGHDSSGNQKRTRLSGVISQNGVSKQNEQPLRDKTPPRLPSQSGPLDDNCNNEEVDGGSGSDSNNNDVDDDKKQVILPSPQVIRYRTRSSGRNRDLSILKPKSYSAKRLKVPELVSSIKLSASHDDNITGSRKLRKLNQTTVQKPAGVQLSNISVTTASEDNNKVLNPSLVASGKSERNTLAIVSHGTDRSSSYPPPDDRAARSIGAREISIPLLPPPPPPAAAVLPPKLSAFEVAMSFLQTGNKPESRSFVAAPSVFRRRTKFS